MYYVLSRAYNWSLEYIEGDFYFECPLTKSPCLRGAASYCGSCKGEVAQPKHIGLTLPMLAEAFSSLLRTRFEELRLLLHSLGLGAKDKDSPEEIARRKADPLFDFPYDIKDKSGNVAWLSADEIKTFQRRTNIIMNRIDTGTLELPQERIDMLWSDERVHAALQDEDLAAKRAAQVDPLWAKYIAHKRTTGKCSLDRVRHFMEIDIARSKLYPLSSVPEQEKLLRERWDYEDKNGLPRTEIRADLPPPQWYLDHLRETGHLEGLKKNLERVIRRKVED